MFSIGNFVAEGQENSTSNAQSEIGGVFQKYKDAGQDQKKKEQAVSGKEQQIRSAAERGDPVAQFLFAKMYDEGWGVPKDKAEAVRWYRKSAVQGNALGQGSLGLMYAKGTGVPKDEAEAVSWFRKSAEQGNALGQGCLGSMYANGTGVPKDEAEAVRWYRKSAEQGDADAQFNLGNKYAKGRGVPKDVAEAVRWFRKSAEQGNAKAENNLELCADLERELAEGKKLEEARKKLIATTKDEGSGKYGGPNTETVIDLLGLGGRLGTLYTNPLIRRGSTLESTGGSKIPARTTMFPIQFKGEISGVLMSLTYYFYKDPFGDWKAVEVEN